MQIFKLITSPNTKNASFDDKKKLKQDLILRCFSYISNNLKEIYVMQIETLVLDLGSQRRQ